MTESISPDESSIRIPRVCILIPGIHSRQKLEPRYVLPLFRAIWKDSMRDPTDTVRIIDMPPNLPEVELYRVLPADSAQELEASRLRAEFGINPRSQEPWFDHVYPAETFTAAFAAALKDAVHSPAGGGTAADILADLEGIDKASAAKLVSSGISTIKEVATADPLRLTKILGKTNAENAREDALFKLNPNAHGKDSDIDAKIASVVPPPKPAAAAKE